MTLPHILKINLYMEAFVMCRIGFRKLAGISAICFGAGIFLSFLLPGYFLAFLEAAALVSAGVLLLRKNR